MTDSRTGSGPASRPMVPGTYRRNPCEYNILCEFRKISSSAARFLLLHLLSQPTVAQIVAHDRPSGLAQRLTRLRPGRVFRTPDPRSVRLRDTRPRRGPPRPPRRGRRLFHIQLPAPPQPDQAGAVMYPLHRPDTHSVLSVGSVSGADRRPSPGTLRGAGRSSNRRVRLRTFEETCESDRGGPTKREPLGFQGLEQNQGLVSVIEEEARAGFEPANDGFANRCPASEKPMNFSTSGDLASSGAATSTDPDLDRVVETWATLPDPIRRAILALIGSADPQPSIGGGR